MSRLVPVLLVALLLTQSAPLPAVDVAPAPRPKAAAHRPPRDPAIAGGVAWLVKQQQADGGWAFDGGAKDDRAGATGLALLTLMSAEPARADDADRDRAKAVAAGLAFLARVQKADGTFGAATVAGHARITLVLLEHLRDSRRTGPPPASAADGPAGKAARALAAMQNPDRGWGDGGKSDPVSTAYAVIALGRAKGFDRLLKVDPTVLNRTADYLRKADPKDAAGLAALWLAREGVLRAPTDKNGKPFDLPRLPAKGGGYDAEHLFLAALAAVNTSPLEQSGVPTAVPLPDVLNESWEFRLLEFLRAAQDNSTAPTRGSFPPDRNGKTDRLAATCFSLFALGLAKSSVEPPEEDLTNVDIGIDANIEAALPNVERIEDVNVPGLPGIDPFGAPGPPEVVGVPGFGSDIGQPDPRDPFGVIGGAGVMPRPDVFAGRTGATKVRLVKESGASAESEAAVARGLAWLAKQQKANGTWEFDGSDKKEIAAATGFALLAFLGAGETHKGNGKYRKVIEAGLVALVRDAAAGGANAGKFTSAGTMYAQGIATLALVEAYGMTKDAALRVPAQSAVNYILKAQGPDGSWGYTAGTRGDTSILGWQIQALHAAKAAGLVVDEKALKKAVAFLDTTAGGSKKSSYGYTSNSGAAPGTSLTAVGLLCRQRVDGWTPNNPGLAEGVTGLMIRAPGGTTAKPRTTKPALDLYFYHYAGQVVRSYGGEEWKDWNEGPKQADGTRKGGLRDWLVGLQVTKDGADQGSWDPEAGWIGRNCGRVGTTALAVLALEVYYRDAPPKAPADKPDAPK